MADRLQVQLMRSSEKDRKQEVKLKHTHTPESRKLNQEREKKKHLPQKNDLIWFKTSHYFQEILLTFTEIKFIVVVCVLTTDELTVRFKFMV